MISFPLVSVIVPVYNTGSIIRRTIRSITSQTYSNFEVFFINDGSNDSTPSLIEDLISDMPNYHLVYKENGGLSSARNLGLSLAKGEYVIFWDDDDYQSHNALTLLVETALLNNSDCVCSGITKVYPDHTKQELYTGEACSVSGHEALKMWLEEKCISTGAVTKLCRKSLLDKYDIKFEEGKINEDLLWTAELLSHSNKVSILGRSLYYYVVRQNSLSNKVSSHSFDVVDNCHKLTKLIKERFPDLLDCCSVFCAKKIFSLIVLSNSKEARLKYPDYRKQSLEIYYSHKKSIEAVCDIKKKLALLLIRLDIYKFLR